MKTIFFNTILLLLLIFTLAGCDKEYPEKVTYEGKNEHGFKLNGEKWVRKKDFLGASECRYESTSEIIGGDLSCSKEGSSDYPFVYFSFLLNAKKNSVVIPANYNFSELNDSILLNYEKPQQLDPAKCYCRFVYEKEKFKITTYSQVISGKLQLLRFDTLLVGTFEVKISNGTDTMNITDGKFDYKLTTE